MTESPNDAFRRMYPGHYAVHDCPGKSGSENTKYRLFSQSGYEGVEKWKAVARCDLAEKGGGFLD